jgi:hypothetical protein
VNLVLLKYCGGYLLLILNVRSSCFIYDWVECSKGVPATVVDW